MQVKIIVSHDVDHISSYEHASDLMVPKYVARALLEMGKGRIGASEFIARMVETVRGRWNQVRELAAYDAGLGIRSCFFFAVANGFGLAYKTDAARSLVAEVRAAGHEVGIHGIARGDVTTLQEERQAFEAVYGGPCRGIRMHYLHSDPALLQRLAIAGYAWDSSLRGDGPAHDVGVLQAFPVHLMDGDIMLAGRRHQSVTLGTALERTQQRLQKLAESGVDYASLLFHDRYFSDAHRTWRDWYCSTLAWAQRQGIGFCSYEEAVAERRSGHART